MNKTNTITKEVFMLRAAIAFFILAIVAILLGVTGVAGVSMEIGKLLLVVFLVLAILSFLGGRWTGSGPKHL
jgi:uncharacterized membrane protein YtjA (UPF0391 family)